MKPTMCLIHCFFIHLSVVPSPGAVVTNIVVALEVSTRPS